MTTLWSFSDKLLKHFREPENVGVIKNADGIGYVGDSSWGIDMELYIKVEDGIIVDAKFRTFGCGASIATSSAITEIIIGKRTTEALNISAQAITEALGGLLPSKKHCAVLGQELIRSAINDYLTKNNRRTDGSK
jgi:nitrogen fixation NifU-like protein